jgi:7-cyano-7-deazaguanine reductase
MGAKRLGILHKNSAIPAPMLQNTREFFRRARFVTNIRPPLGQETAYPSHYDPSVLFPIARADSRAAFLSGKPGFDGVDLWNAWELTWLGAGNRPAVATAEIRVPASSPNLVESKSLKLYLNSYSMSQFESADAVAKTMAEDLTACAGGTVDVRVDLIGNRQNVARLPGQCLDTLDVTCDQWEVEPLLLQADTKTIVHEELYTDLLRSLCPVTSQPDIGSLAVHYQGPRIDPRSLLKYVVSFREHNDFHEACIERMFVDIEARCHPEKLSVYARYQRRGGIDINPFRSNFETQPRNARIWRQ